MRFLRKDIGLSLKTYRITTDGINASIEPLYHCEEDVRLKWKSEPFEVVSMSDLVTICGRCNIELIIK